MTARSAAVPPACRPGVRLLGHVGWRASTGNDGEPECRLEVRPHAVVEINVDASPQPYQRLERTIVEDGQQFAAVREFSPPQHVTLGLDAAWIPDLSEVITADQRVLITVTVSWPHSRPTARRALAIRLARAYLAG